MLIKTIGKNNQINRENWLQNALGKVPNGARILDAGAGEQQYKKFCTHLNYVSQDFAQYDGIGDGKGLQTEMRNHNNLDIISDIIDIPEPDNSFDAILCVEVLEHLPNPIAALQEFRRLLKPNGILIITAPFCSITHYSPYHFYSGFNRYFYEKYLPEFNFKIEELVPNGNYFEYIAQEVTLRLPNKYTKYRLTLFDKYIKKIFIQILNKMNDLDDNSSDLLCYGYHVKAISIKK